VLAGVDVDFCTFFYDGTNVCTTPRGHSALTNGFNTVSMSRRSPSYEQRLAKYGSRGFEVLLPGMKTIFGSEMLAKILAQKDSKVSILFT